MDDQKLIQMSRLILNKARSSNSALKLKLSSISDARAQLTTRMSSSATFENDSKKDTMIELTIRLESLEMFYSAWSEFYDAKVPTTDSRYIVIASEGLQKCINLKVITELIQISRMFVCRACEPDVSAIALVLAGLLAMLLAGCFRRKMLLAYTLPSAAI